MKLNNKGWGLVTFLMFLLMFFMFLLVIAILCNRLNARFDSNNTYIMNLIEK